MRGVARARVMGARGTLKTPIRKLAATGEKPATGRVPRGGGAMRRVARLPSPPKKQIADGPERPNFWV